MNSNEVSIPKKASHLEEGSPTVIYIGGYGRSGSTLLDTILSNHEGMFGGGELECFFQDLTVDGACTCGEHYRDCPFWQEILERLNSRFPDFDVATLAQQQINVESTLGRYRIAPWRLRKEVRHYGEVWSTIFRAIRDISQNPFIVDSSKSSRGNSRRISALKKHAGLDVKVLHLIRDPRAVVYSEWGRGHNDQIEYKAKLTEAVGGMVRPMVGWSMANLAVSLTSRQDKSLDVHRIYYEDLAQDPIQTLQEISQFLKVDLSLLIGLLQADMPMQPGHGVRGNRMRRQGPIRMKVDYEWIDAMPAAARGYTRLLWPVARQYGYDVRTWPHTESRVSKTISGTQSA